VTCRFLEAGVSGRRIPLGIAGGAILFATAACNTSALSKQELVVYFNQGAPMADHAAALQACAHATPDATPEPISTSSLPSNAVGDVRFRIDHANDREVALLTECLAKQPGVRGVDVPDLTN
jgi:hypothetical protein